MPESPTVLSKRVGIIVLAAGRSSRMGTPKQLLKISGSSLIQRATKTALATSCAPCVVVLGANAELILPELTPFQITVVTNRNWNTGMAGSIQCGLKASLEVDSKLDAILLMVGDQPALSAASLKQIVTAFCQNQGEIIAASYPDGAGTPALFAQSYFADLFALKGESGAKSLLQKNINRVVALPLPNVNDDLDTPADVARLRNQPPADE